MVSSKAFSEQSMNHQFQRTALPRIVLLAGRIGVACVRVIKSSIVVLRVYGI